MKKGNPWIGLVVDDPTRLKPTLFGAVQTKRTNKANNYQLS